MSPHVTVKLHCEVLFFCVEYIYIYIYTYNRFFLPASSLGTFGFAFAAAAESFV